MTVSEINVFGSLNEVANIQFQLPGTVSKRNESIEVKVKGNTVEVSDKDITVESHLPLSEKCCAGCGPNVECNIHHFLNLFINPTSHQTEIRKGRLLKVSSWNKKDKGSAGMTLRDTDEAGFTILMDSIESILKSGFDTSMRFEDDSKYTNSEEKKPPTFNPDDPTFSKGILCFDTPGAVNQKQLTNIFTLSN
uniref:SHSP domain-containing protein n=1 Tax=Rhabditophanes sp. KR3021 TaxID=114890 RepID=A0AC35TIG2_9BILA